MATTSSAVAVGTTAVLVSAAEINSKLVYLQDGDFAGDTEVFVGGGDVTIANGLKLSKTNSTVIQTYQGDQLYCIASAAGGSVRVLEIN